MPSGPVLIHLNDDEQFAAGTNITGPNNATPYPAINVPRHRRKLGHLSKYRAFQQGTVLSPVGSDIQGGGATLFTNNSGPNAGQQILGIFYGVHVDSVRRQCRVWRQVAYSTSTALAAHRSKMLEQRLGVLQISRSVPRRTSTLTIHALPAILQLVPSLSVRVSYMALMAQAIQQQPSYRRQIQRLAMAPHRVICRLIPLSPDCGLAY